MFGLIAIKIIPPPDNAEDGEEKYQKKTVEDNLSGAIAPKLFRNV
jgi:hypothetical protein